MKVLFSQASQECGSSGVSLCLGRDRLAQVGIGESVVVDLPDSSARLEINCGSYSFAVEVERSQELEVSWALRQGAMVIRRDKKEIGSVIVA